MIRSRLEQVVACLAATMETTTAITEIMDLTITITMIIEYQTQKTAQILIAKVWYQTVIVKIWNYYFNKENDFLLNLKKPPTSHILRMKNNSTHLDTKLTMAMTQDIHQTTTTTDRTLCLTTTIIVTTTTTTTTATQTVVTTTAIHPITSTI